MLRTTVTFFWLVLCPLLSAAEWPQWRGPEGQGHAAARDLPVTWSETENIAWRTELPGRGWSSPVIEGDQIWVTAAVDIPVSEEEKARRIANSTNNQPLSVAGSVSLRAVCVHRVTGSLLHDVELLTKLDPEPIHTLNTYASPSPLLDRGRLYCHFGANGTACLDTQTLRVLWTNDDLQILHENGPGSTPVLWGDYLIVHCDGSDAQYIAALDKHTGKLAWKTPRSGTMNEEPQLKKSYGTPLVVEVDRQPQVISPAADWLYAYDPLTGRELWKVAYETLGFSISPRPVFGHGKIYMSTSFLQSELLAVDLSGATPTIAWRYKRQVPQTSSPLLVGDELYFVSDRGIASCIDAHTGEMHWSERLGGDFSSSPLWADGRIYVGNREGTMFVLAPGKTFQQLAANQLEGAIMATPAAVDRALYLRTDKALYRIEKKSRQ